MNDSGKAMPKDMTQANVKTLKGHQPVATSNHSWLVVAATKLSVKPP